MIKINGLTVELLRRLCNLHYIVLLSQVWLFIYCFQKPSIMPPSWWRMYKNYHKILVQVQK